MERQGLVLQPRIFGAGGITIRALDKEGQAIFHKVKAACIGIMAFGRGLDHPYVERFFQGIFHVGILFASCYRGARALFFRRPDVQRDVICHSLFGFMIPLPLIAIVGITFKLKLFAAYWANKVVNALGVRAILDGSVIKMAHTHVIVEDVCSGLRSLISLLALGTIIAYLSKLSRWKKVVVFFAAGVMAIIANIVRIVFMALTSEIYGAKFTEGFLHTLSGLIVFVVAFAGLMIVVKELE